ncbi:hypothetical protein COB21_03815 [Candidatus Aerophobetes bacterium]|uniref:Glutaredoxin domain-containing protein n=1 Tax=Aerophobetes bacterium TaxID=2030807 RepID=A0A2A4X418_UNCAE|nr:MAG: hypothetical protein COB21_03815 [Candidatus Aerophobetes bacterium]
MLKFLLVTTLFTHQAALFAAPSKPQENVMLSSKTQYKKLEFIYKKSCPFCTKVLKAFPELESKVRLREVYEDEDAMVKLEQMGAKKQFPCLMIDDEPYYESDLIIEWFQKNL